MEYNKNQLVNVVGTVYKWRRPMLIFIISATVIATIVSIFLPNYYEASTIFYAASPDLQSPAAIFDEQNQKIEFFGEGEDRDRLLQAANSNELLEFLTEKFNLYEHYDIDTTNPKAPYKLRLRFKKYFTVIKNERDAIVLTVEDKNPEIAANMANVAREKINNIVNNLSKATLRTIMKTYEIELKQKEVSLQAIADSLVVLRAKYGVFDAEQQREVIAQRLPVLKSNLAGQKAKLKFFQNQAGRRDSITKTQLIILGLEQQILALTQGNNGTNISQGISKIGQLMQFEEVLSEQYELERSKFGQYKSALEISQPSLLVQDIAVPPVVKSRPKRSLIIIGVAFLAFLLGMLAVLILEYNRDIDWKSVTNPQ